MAPPIPTKVPSNLAFPAEVPRFGFSILQCKKELGDHIPTVGSNQMKFNNNGIHGYVMEHTYLRETTMM